MTQDPSFHQVLDRLRQRDDRAASVVYRRFAQRLIGLAHNQLDQRLRKKVDAEDVIQSVFKSVFQGLNEGKFALVDWNSLWALLTAVAVNKCRGWVDYYRAQARDVGREMAAPDEATDANWQALDREPGPSEAMALTETLEEVLEGLEPREQEIVRRGLEGADVAEIAQQVGCTQSKVYRVLRLVRDRLERMREDQP